VDHRRGKDPTPQGRTPDVVRRPDQTPATDATSEKYENSAPGPSAREDGVYFFGYKNENAYQNELEKQ
jgi:hypothetical protein